MHTIFRLITFMRITHVSFQVTPFPKQVVTVQVAIHFTCSVKNLLLQFVAKGRTTSVHVLI